ncbi:gliding motility-associated C-terminal domain-containing protein [Flavobacterium sp. LS1R49]|uniref:Gliding motility-associated C-terminal domain-containing protein n=1 Tax=Flavobacterium shii TaxID=2987687 RepID=A0A9X2ZFA8_9FLAO|nr:gliding motility-associated C-terminal domain-containing protein [Flavobacterium shii]MCV9928350.1 gliding motility-associated C-terminal domain-containing protein [Flavobacterium shii]
MAKNYFVALKLLLFSLALFLLPTKSIAQCAGIDTEVKICDIENPVNESINLLGLLDGSPTAGGKWSDDSNTQALDVKTGILYAQNITSGGIYEFTYTVPAVPGCVKNTAKLRITIGAYAGVAAPFATPCSDREAYNLFEAFNGTVMGPHKNGTWTNSDGQVVSSSFPIKGLQGIFKFTYTVPPVPGCVLLIPSVTVWITVVRAPESGTANDLLLCGSTDLAAYTNFDLHDLLSGHDAGGEWKGPGLTSPADHNVNLQQLFDTSGAGDYTYVYTVLAPTLNGHRPCSNKSVSAIITLEKSVDFTGATLVVNSDICETEIPNAIYFATLRRGPEVIPDGKYNVTYSISGPAGTTVNTELLTLNNGMVTFPLSATYFQQVGAFKVEITSIVADWNKGACVNIVNDLSDILNVFPTPNIDSAKLKIDPICQKENALVQITEASSLTDGTYRIVYKLGGANVINGVVVSISVINGVSSFVIPSALISNEGNTSVVITNITNTITNCTNTANVAGSIVVKSLPNPINYKIHIDDFCLNEPVLVSLSGLGTLTDIIISYTISGSNLAPTQMITLVVSGGKTSFVIPQNLFLNTGSTTVSITSLRNNETGCGIVITSLSDDFLVNPIPIAPTAGPMSFCKSDGATVANLLPNGTQYKWYDSVTATTPLTASSILVSKNYYVKETALSSGCVSPATSIIVTINDVASPVLNQKGQNFCGIDNPTIANLSNNTNASASVVWYDAPDNGNPLTNAVLLQDNATYYGFDFSNTINCFSNDALIVKVSLTNCTDTQYGDFFIPDGFSPNGDGINDTYTIPGIDFLYPNYTLEIYNRYGNLMFRGNKSKPDWDGKNSDSKIIDGVAPNGVYFYVVNFNKDNRPPIQGRLYLNR